MRGMTLQTNYTCPICMKTIIDATEYFKRIDMWVKLNPMPEEYRDWKRTILCNDCEKINEVAFNFMYHKVRKGI